MSAAATRPYEELTTAQRRRLLAGSLLRSFGTSLLLAVLYFALPLDRGFGTDTAVALVAGLLGFAVVLAWQIRAIVRSGHPRLRAVEGLAVALPMLLLVSSVICFELGRQSPGSFSESMSRLDALYFSVTLFATVGLGDITPTSEPARVLVTVQMLANLTAVGVVSKVLIGAVQMGIRRRGPQPAPAEATGHPGRAARPPGAARRPTSGSGGRAPVPVTGASGAEAVTAPRAVLGPRPTRVRRAPGSGRAHRDR